MTVYFSYALPYRGGVKLGDLSAPSQTAMTNDGVHPAVDGARGCAPGDCGGFTTGGWCDNDGVATEADFLHNGGDNVVMWDGHAKWYQFNSLRVAAPDPSTIWRTD
jgi:prepilin-type processing-associated H-X9-DG protein